MKNQKGFTRQNFNKKISGGFTLIELLVVIAIIGILASVILASLNSARVKARNARRASDIKQLQSAFALAGSDTGALPDSSASVGGWACVSATCYEGWAGYAANSTVDAFIATTMPSKPIDPPGGRGYGGYIYNSAYSGSVQYDGSTITAGPVINWLLEPPYRAGMCGPGSTNSVAANYVSCLLGVVR